MGILQIGDQTILLAARHLIGRSRSMNTTLRHSGISGQHAAIRWTGEHWVIRDLGSRNGTTVADTTLPPGQDIPLNLGDVVRFGSAEPYRFTSDAAPAPTATFADKIIEGDGDFLALPSAEDPRVIITWDESDGWVMLQGESSSRAQDGQRITVEDQTYVLGLPETLTGTQQATAEQTVDQLAVHFRVSADEEYVECRVTVRGKVTALKPKAQHYLLLTLARQRIADAASDLAEAEQGWVYSEQLERMLRASSNQVYVTIHRLRKEFSQFEMLDTTEIVQRRPTTRQVRIGTAHLSVAGMD